MRKTISSNTVNHIDVKHIKNCKKNRCSLNNDCNDSCTHIATSTQGTIGQTDNMQANRYSIISKLDINTFDPALVNKHIFDSYKFRNENSKDISMKLLFFAEKNIKNYESVDKLLNIIYDIDIVNEIESGIFEFSLLHVITHGLEFKTVVPIYHDKVQDIMHNLKDPTNETLMRSILNNNIMPYAVAFLSPQQLNPSKWISILNKKKFRENAENNMATTDRYRCSKCGENKAKVTELQIKSADEPTNLFVTCLVCYSTSIK